MLDLTSIDLRVHACDGCKREPPQMCFVSDRALVWKNNVQRWKKCGSTRHSSRIAKCTPMPSRKPGGRPIMIIVINDVITKFTMNPGKGTPHFTLGRVIATYKGSTVRMALRPADRRPDEISRTPGQNHGARRFYSVPAGQDADAPKQGGDHQRRRGDVAAGRAAQVIDEVVSDGADVRAACCLGMGLR